MTAPVDVLARLDRWVEGICRDGGTPYDAMEVRAAVAELNRRACDALELLEDVAPDHVRTTKLRAALARVSGGAA